MNPVGSSSESLGLQCKKIIFFLSFLFFVLFEKDERDWTRGNSALEETVLKRHSDTLPSLKTYSKTLKLSFNNTGCI